MGNWQITNEYYYQNRLPTATHITHCYLPISQYTLKVVLMGLSKAEAIYYFCPNSKSLETGLSWEENQFLYQS